MNINQLLETTISKNASDLHLLVGFSPQLRIHGELVTITDLPLITVEDMQILIDPLLNKQQKDLLISNWELDLGISFEEKARFRINLYMQKGTLAASFRFIPNIIPTIAETGLPEQVAKIVDLKQGLILVTGPTGHGKSTTLAAFINQINQTRGGHIITIEDPVEFVYPKAKAIVSQRELNADTKSWNAALKSALREDPDVVLIGELRDLETISAAMTIAETGHLVLATLHTNSAAQTVDRIIDVFPDSQQGQIRTQLSSVIEAIISLRLVPTIKPGRTIAPEILFGVPALRSLIRESKSYLIDNLIQTSGEYGMKLLETSLAELVHDGQITTDTALDFSLRPHVISKLIRI